MLSTLLAGGPFFHLQSVSLQPQLLLSHRLAVILILPPLPYKDTCDYIGPSWIIQEP